MSLREAEEIQKTEFEGAARGQPKAELQGDATAEVNEKLSDLLTSDSPDKLLHGLSDDLREDFLHELPDELAQLGGQLRHEAERLASHYPAGSFIAPIIVHSPLAVECAKEAKKEAKESDKVLSRPKSEATAQTNPGKRKASPSPQTVLSWACLFAAGAVSIAGAVWFLAAAISWQGVSQEKRQSLSPSQETVAQKTVSSDSSNVASGIAAVAPQGPSVQGPSVREDSQKSHSVKTWSPGRNDERVLHAQSGEDRDAPPSLQPPYASPPQIFLYNVTGPELEAVIDLWEQQPHPQKESRPTSLSI